MQTAQTASHVWMRAHEQSDVRLLDRACMGPDLQEEPLPQAALPYRR